VSKKKGRKSEVALDCDKRRSTRKLNQLLGVADASSSSSVAEMGSLVYTRTRGKTRKDYVKNS
jgi:hypothetical protein